MMSVLAPPSTSAATLRKPTKPQQHRITVSQFHDLLASNFFGTRRLMLIDGIVLEKEYMNAPHMIACDLVGAELRAVFGNGWIVREDKPLLLGLYTDPRPDFQVLPGAPRDYTDVPTTAALIVEVADTSLAYDNGEKADLYAKAGIQDYWVLDLNQSRLFVFRGPSEKGYAEQLEYDASQSVNPLAVPNSKIQIKNMLP